MFEKFTENVLSNLPTLVGAGGILLIGLTMGGVVFVILTVIEVRQARAQRRWINIGQKSRENRRRSKAAGVAAHIIRDPAVVERTEKFGGLNQKR